MTASFARRVAAFAGPLLAAVLLFSGAAAAPAAAATLPGAAALPGAVALPGAAAILPGAATGPAAAGSAGVSAAAARREPTDDEGGTKSLRTALEAAARGHLEAKAKLDNSMKRQLRLVVDLRQLEAEVQQLTVQVGLVAAKSYRLGRLNSVSLLLNAADPDSFLDRVAGLDVMAQRDSKQLRRYLDTRKEVARTKLQLDTEVREQRRQLAILAKKKRDAERALATVGGQASGGFVSASSPLAKPAPRRSDGSWPSELCTINDPTTGGCITPRTLHALRQAQSAGFTRHASCHRSGGGGEHPRGRACDFSAAARGFANVDATGGDRSYGDRLAGYLVKNAGRLGVLYVIWYRQIWMPGTGWSSYSGGGGPSGTHTNHVHLSMV